MNYVLSEEVFRDTFVDKSNKFKHTPGKRFKLFPFTAQQENKSPAVLDLNNVVGRFLSVIEGIEPEELDLSDLFKKIKQDTEIEPGKENLFNDIIRQMFFYSNGQVRPLNLKLLSQVSCNKPSEVKIADYLVDVLGDKQSMKTYVEKANQRLDDTCNVFEKLVLSKLESKTINETDSIPYFRITNAFQSVFQSDFEYILENQNRVREYLIPLLEFYFFIYTAQTCMELDRFWDGDRNNISGLFFSLEWEKTSQSRKCFTEGWLRLQSSIERMFPHAVVLEILNQTQEPTDPIDYISIRQLIGDSTDLDQYFAEQVDKLTEYYRSLITDCHEMTDLVKEELAVGHTASSIQYLFDSVKTQFDNTGRQARADNYADKFERYCHKFLKSRGRSGLMLNMSEETLIFMTKISIKNQEQMRLNDVFKEFERRGVFLDDLSKEQVADYYERLNLIEKKSDSGDAKYVKRIL